MPKNAPYRAVLAVIAVVLATVAAPVASAATQPCSEPPSPAGDWPLGGHDLNGSRSQPAERVLTPARAAKLKRAWSFNTGSPSGVNGVELSDYNSTPVVSGGCLYIGAARGLFVALNADTGKVVWKRQFNVADDSSGIFIGAPAIAGNKVIALVSEEGDGKSLGPYAVALDRRTGKTIWQSKPVSTVAENYTHATPVVAGGVVLAGFSAWEGDPDGHGGLALIDASSGDLLKVTHTIPPQDWVGPDGQHYGGGGVWTTPTVDRATGYAYMGTGNPYSKKGEHAHTNAIIKVDVDRSRATFGQIVDHYKGDIDQYQPVIREATRVTCEIAPDHPLREHLEYDNRQEALQGAVSNSHACGQLDLGFGAAANLFRDARGRLIVGALEKSGTYHAAYADGMERAWTSVVGLPCQVCNGASTAYDAERKRVLAVFAPGTWLTGIDAAVGAVRWRFPVADGVHYGAVTTAAGVAYTISNHGLVFVNRVDTGAPITQLRLFADAGVDAVGFASSGVSIARNTVFAAAGSHVVAYRAPGAVASKRGVARAR